MMGKFSSEAQAKVAMVIGQAASGGGKGVSSASWLSRVVSESLLIAPDTFVPTSKTSNACSGRRRRRNRSRSRQPDRCCAILLP
jgi:hypothetical protein